MSNGNRPPTPDEAFAAGAGAMQSQIVAMLMVSGHIALAPKVLSLPLPPFKMPEKLTL